MKTKIILFLIGSFIISCSTVTESSKERHEEKDSEKKSDSVVQNGNTENLRVIRSIINKSKPISLPFAIRLHQFDPNIKEMTVYPLKSNESELLMKDQQNFVYGYLPDTSNYFGILSFVPADYFVPVLILYSKNGKKNW